MNRPRKWNFFLRPGLMIPVFFLPFFEARTQIAITGASTAAMGRCFAAGQGSASIHENQAGLGWKPAGSVTIQHALPFMIPELGISTIGIMVPAGSAGLGMSLSHMGISGLQYSSFWLSCGLRLAPGITAGAGLHLWNSSLEEGSVHHPAISTGIGLQVRINDRLTAGGHVLHPFSWSAGIRGKRVTLMVITTGLAYTFFRTATFYSDLHVLPGSHIQLGHGMEVFLRDRFVIMIGTHNRPFAISGGLRVAHSKWDIDLCFEYILDTGSTPYSSLTYDW